MKKYILIILTLIASVLNSQNFISEPYKIKYSDMSPGKFLSQETSGWEIWDGSSFSGNKSDFNTMITLSNSFSVPENFKNQILGISIETTTYPIRVYVNGFLILQSGNIEENKVANGFTSTKSILPPQILKNNNDIKIEIYPYGYLNPFSNLVVSTYKEVSTKSFWKSFFSSYLIRAISFVCFIMSFYFLFLYLTQSNKHFSYVLFSCLNMALVLSYLEISFAFDYSHELIIMKLSKIGFVLALTALLNFVLEFTNTKKLRKIISGITIIVSTTFLIMIILQPSRYKVDIVLSIMTTYYFPLVVLLCLYLIIFAFIKTRNTDTLIVLIAYFIFLGTIFHDLLYVIINITPYAYVVPYGFLMFILAMFLIMTNEQNRIARTNKEQAESIKKINHSQVEMIKEIKNVTSIIKDSEGNLREKIELSAKIISQNSNTNKKISNEIKDQVKNIEQTLPIIKIQLSNSIEDIIDAAQKQTDFASKIENSLEVVNSKMDNNQINISETNKRANYLSQIAQENKVTITNSTKAVKTIKEHAKVISDVLLGIMDISERTDLLAVNAAIESAHAGDAGKGFAVVANEVRKLSSQSKEQVDTSSQKLNAMERAIEITSELSDEVEKGLFTIIDETLNSSKLMNKTRENIEDQYNETKDLLSLIKTLILETTTIKTLSESNKTINTDVQKILVDFKEMLESTFNLIETQEIEIMNLKETIYSIEELFKVSIKNSESLRSMLVVTK